MSNEEIVNAELDKVPGYQIYFGYNRKILCPFHSDRATPSLSVCVSSQAPVPLGVFYCFGCGITGGWNKLAKSLSLREIQVDPNDGKRPSLDFKKLEKNLFGKGLEAILEEMGSPLVKSWPEEVSWRGFSGSFIKKMGGLTLLERSRTDDSTLKVFFPVCVNGTVVGGIRAAFEKPQMGPSYINTKGDWSKKAGLLFFDQSKKLALSQSALAIVEGPRDALRLIENGIPAVSVLGSTSFSKEKAKRLATLNLDTYYLIPDNDEAGEKMKDLVRSCAELILNLRVLNLPKADKNGDLIKIDPNSCSQHILDKIKKTIGDRKC